MYYLNLNQYFVDIVKNVLGVIVVLGWYLDELNGDPGSNKCKRGIYWFLGMLGGDRGIRMALGSGVRFYRGFWGVSFWGVITIGLGIMKKYYYYKRG
jgi:hypothetical protein